MSQLKIKVFLLPQLPRGEFHPALYELFGYNENLVGLKDKAVQFKYNIEVVEDPESADIMMIPNALKVITPEIRIYLDDCYKVIYKYQKPFIVTLFGDSSHDSHLPYGIVLKTSLYRNSLTNNEIAIPAYAEDLGGQFKSARVDEYAPVVSFCGFAELKGLRKVKYYLKLAFTFLSPERVVGIYYRRKLMNVFLKNKFIHSIFIVRDSFSAARSTLSAPYHVLRKEFIDNILSSQYVIAPKGDGNYSNRFYEVLSLGRVPIIPDTELVLPLEKIIDYSPYIIKVPIKELSSAPEIVLDHFNKNKTRWNEYEREAMDFYSANLRFDVCFNKILSLIIEGSDEVFAKI